MKPSPHPLEDDRLRELRRYAILDTQREREFDELVEIASEICQTPVSVINFIDHGRQWFKAEVGLGVRSTPLETSLCGHAILQGDYIEIPDTLADARMADNPLCTSDPGFRFYAGSVLKGANGLPLGTLCVLDHKPRELTEHQRRVLRVLSRHIMRELDLRISLEREQTLRREVDHRVKNSLASISALLSMKARRENNIAVRYALEDAISRIRSLSALHEELHELGCQDQVSLKSLFARIETGLQRLLSEGIELKISTSDVSVAPELANSLILVVNEFVANSAKHAFSLGVGSIAVDIKVQSSQLALVCRDNGNAGQAEAERAAIGTGLGTRVIQSIASSLNLVPQWHASGNGMELKLSGPLTTDVK
ncbi:sensor histidine kinase [Novosphingobium olei]|uniref:sensor histidine kinase n=1 Tax=Novosphingobium olei TaxID=2728851 RepID=UPI003084F71B|nr:GAF domain-containing protein [Novosphingobium olei]